MSIAVTMFQITTKLYKIRLSTIQEPFFFPFMYVTEKVTALSPYNPLLGQAPYDHMSISAHDPPQKKVFF